MAEGVRNVTHHLISQLNQEHTVYWIRIRDIPKRIISLKRMKPDIIHMIVGPSSIMGFIILRLISFLLNDTPTIMSAPQPSRIKFMFLISKFKPNLILVQSEESKRLFKKYGCKTEFLPNGVDIDKFSLIDNQRKKKLRNKYGINQDTFIILHVGHITEGRNLLSLIELNSPEYQVLIIGSPSTKVDNRILGKLLDSGVIVWGEYFDRIQDIYAISDCYVFPTLRNVNSIEIPLSVMEAMACNIPVISTKFYGMKELFPESEKGFYYVENMNQAKEIICQIMDNDHIVETRSMVETYSWNEIIKKLEKIYQEIK